LGITQKVNSPCLTVFPNPFLDYVKIQVKSQNHGMVKMKIYNQVGQVIFTDKTKFSEDGSFDYIWNGHDSSGKRLPDGIYYLQVSIDEYVIMRKLILL